MTARRIGSAWRRGLYVLASLLAYSGIAAPGIAAPGADRSTLAAWPPQVTLAGPKARQQLLIQQRAADGYAADVTGRTRFTTSNPRVVRVAPGGTLLPVGDGSARITATVGDKTTHVAVTVRNSRAPFTWSFVNHVQPVLTKTGCNSGACHGALAGKGGLKLTLRGYDSPADYDTLTRQALGRRLIPGKPGESLLLQKPVMTIPHGGGPRFKSHSPEHGVLAQWIAAGAPGPSPRDPAMTRLDVFPARVRLRPGQTHQVLVRAVFADGRTEDVTRWVKFGTADENVAAVSDDGLVTVKGSGEAAITVWYLNQVAFAQVTSPFPRRLPESVFATVPRRNFIDDEVVAKLRELRLAPATMADDATFIRRAYLDATGILPTAAEVERFLANTDPNRRAALIDELLRRPEFDDYWAYKWSDLLLVSSRKLPSRAMWSYYRWIRESVAANKPWDRFAREILTATGSTLSNGAGNYFVLHKDPIDLTETTTQAFLGMSLTCARCHNHPLEKWTQNDYYSLANLFARVRMKAGDLPGETLVFSASDGEINHPRSGVPMPPRPLDSTTVAAEGEDRRALLATWLTSPQNPYFSRALINRVWRNFMGRGLVEAEDDLRLTNPPSNERLMAALVKDFTGHDFDVRHLIRTIMNSAAYQRSSEPAAGNPPDGKYYSTYVPRRLPAEVLLDIISQATGVATAFTGYPAGTRAMQLPDAQVNNTFLAAFGRPQRVQTCSCERTEEPSVAQALHLNNGETINGKLRARGGLVDSLLATPLSDGELLDRIYLTALSRKPKPGERARLLAAMAETPPTPTARREMVEDLLAAVLTSKEFLFNR